MFEICTNRNDRLDYIDKFHYDSWLFTLPYIEFRGSALHYIDLDHRDDPNKGIPLVFVHGCGASHIVWVEQIKEFAKTNRVIAIDLSGHGMSDEREEVIDIDSDYAYELAALIAKLKLKDFALIGHSMGGGVILSYVLNPEFQKPRALTLVDTSSDLDLSRLLVGLIIETFENYLDRTHHLLTRDGYPLYDIKGSEIHHRKISKETIQRDLAACNKFDVTERLGEIDIPSFLLFGEDDDIITPHIAKNLQESLPRADIAVIKGADHSPMVEVPEIFNSLLRKYIDWVEKNALE